MTNLTPAQTKLLALIEGGTVDRQMLSDDLCEQHEERYANGNTRSWVTHLPHSARSMRVLVSNGLVRRGKRQNYCAMVSITAKGRDALRANGDNQ